MLFQGTLKENLCVVANDVGLSLSVEGTYSRSAHVFDLICAEQDSLAEEVAQNVVHADELHAPIKSV